MKNIFKRSISAITALSAVTSVICASSAFAEITPNPVISRNCPAYSGAGDAKSANDEHYFSFCSVTSPDYLAYDLSAVPDNEKKQVIAVWYTTSSFDKIGSYVNSNMIPSDYTIEVNKAEGGEYPEDNWEIVETVRDNTLASRQHVVDMEGYNWIRLNITKADGQEGKNASVNFDVHNVSDCISDSWLFLGDSITAGGMNNCYGTGFATHINQIDSKYFPIQENGGIGGIRSSDGKENIDRWLSVSHAKYVSIAYGTNDCWGNPNATQEYYENMKYMVDAVLDAGKIPVLPKIPASTNDDVKDNVPLYNQMIDKLYNEYGGRIIQGVNFEAFFTEHPDYLSADGVHPNDTGYAEMRKIWAETMYKNVYSVKNEQQAVFGFGDVDENGIVDARDASLISREYSRISTGADCSFSEEQQKHADVNRDNLIDLIDAFYIVDYYSSRLAGSTATFESYISNEDDGVTLPPLEKNLSDGYTDEEIKKSNYTPYFTLEAEPDSTNDRIINLKIDISGAQFRWSAMGFVLDYDSKLIPTYNGYKVKVKWGEAVSYMSHSVVENKNTSQLVISAIDSSDMGQDGTVVTIPFQIPDNVSGINDYTFSINYNGGELFTDMTDSESARLMQAYLFTHGLDSTEITVDSGGENADVLIGDANCDGYVNIADAAAIIQALGNKDKYGLSEQGAKNADCYNVGDGVTGMDALAIQRFEAKQIDRLPLNE